MSTTTAPPPTKGLSEAQEERLMRMTEKLNNRLISSKSDGDNLIVTYRTTSGYYAMCLIPPAGKPIKTEFFQFWDDIYDVPIGRICTRWE